MSDLATDVVFQAVPARRVATITRSAAGYGSRNIGPVVGPMFPEVEALLVAAGVASGAAVAVYDSDEAGVGSGFEVEADVAAVPGLDVHDLAALERAAVATHHGSVETIDRSWHALMEATRAGGFVPCDAPREIYLTPGDRPQSEWVTRLVQPVTTL